MKNTLLIAVRFIAGVLMTFAVAAAQQTTAVEQPELAPAKIPAGNRGAVEQFARSQVNFISLRLMKNGGEIDLGFSSTGKRELGQPSPLEEEARIGMDQVLKTHLSKVRKAGLTVSAEDEYHFVLNFQARYQAGTGVLDPKGSVIGTDLRDIRSTPFHLQKVGEVWTIPSEGYGFTLDWFRPDNSVMVGIPAPGVVAVDRCMIYEGMDTYIYRFSGYEFGDGLVLVSTLQLACEVNFATTTKGWLTLWYDETSGSRVNYDLRTGSQIPWGHDKVPRLGITPGRYPGSVFVTLANLEVGQAYTIVSATEVTDTKTNVVGTVRADDYTGEPVFFPIGSGDSSQFFGVRPATRDELIGARKTSSFKGN